jgi:hypothetical protein
MSSTETSSRASEEMQDTPRDLSDDLPLVDGLITPQVQPSVLRHHAETLKKLKERERQIEDQQELIHNMTQALNQQRDNMPQTVGNLPNSRSTVQETPGPHRLQPKAERPEDIAFKQKQAEQQDEEARKTLPQDLASPEQTIFNIFTSLQQVIANNNKHLHASEISVKWFSSI